jgi:hypothetical protein
MARHTMFVILNVLTLFLFTQRQPFATPCSPHAHGDGSSFFVVSSPMNWIAVDPDQGDDDDINDEDVTVAGAVQFPVVSLINPRGHSCSIHPTPLGISSHHGVYLNLRI